MAITTFKRYEKKIMMSDKQYELFIKKLMNYMNYDSHCQNGKMYTIYNIYYDTDNDDVINYSLSKPYYKEKLRLRSYRPVKSDDDEVFLELKKKINGIVSKRRVVLTMGEAKLFLNRGIRPCKKDYISEQVLNEISYFLKMNNVKPTVVINYQMMAFFGKEDNDFRVTFDTAIKTRRDKLYLGGIDCGKNILNNGEKLMEIKILGSVPLWLSRILSEQGLYPRGFSKYGSEFENYCIEEKYQNLRRTNIC